MTEPREGWEAQGVDFLYADDFYQARVEWDSHKSGWIASFELADEDPDIGEESFLARGLPSAEGAMIAIEEILGACRKARRCKPD